MVCGSLHRACVIQRARCGVQGSIDIGVAVGCSIGLDMFGNPVGLLIGGVLGEAGFSVGPLTLVGRGVGPGVLGTTGLVGGNVGRNGCGVGRTGVGRTGAGVGRTGGAVARMAGGIVRRDGT